MREELTRDFEGAKEKGLKIFYNDTTGDYDVMNATEEECLFSIYDEENEEGDGSNGKAVKEVKKFIEEF